MIVLLGELCQGVTFVRGHNCPGNDCQGHNCPGNDCLGNNCSGNDCQGNNCPGKDCQGNNCQVSGVEPRTNIHCLSTLTMCT
jgi:hypothetical protein